MPTLYQHRRSSRGFTLIELMTVVAILGILAAVAVVAYTRNVRRAHKAQVMADLASLSMRQHSFLGITGNYASSAGAEGPEHTYPTMDDIEDGDGGRVQWNVADEAYTLAGEADAMYLRGGGALHGFDVLRFVPEGGGSYCGYATLSGVGANDPNTPDIPPTDPIGAELFPDASADHRANDWFYAYALCDFDSDGTYSVFTAAHYASSIGDVSFGPYVSSE